MVTYDDANDGFLAWGAGRAETPASGGTPEGRDPTAEPPGARVLVVDDEPLLRNALCRFLRRAGFVVVEVGSVAKALDELTSGNKDGLYAAAVVDLLLKDGDGEDVVRACEAASPSTNIIVLSANIDSRRALDLSGRCVCLPKPVSAETLLDALCRRRDPIAEFSEQHGLTSREREAVVAAANGLSLEEAATTLGLTPEGLRKRWRQICGKTACETRHEVLGKLIQQLSVDATRGGGRLYARLDRG